MAVIDEDVDRITRICIKMDGAFVAGAVMLELSRGMAELWTSRQGRGAASSRGGSRGRDAGRARPEALIRRRRDGRLPFFRARRRPHPPRQLSPSADAPARVGNRVGLAVGVARRSVGCGPGCGGGMDFKKLGNISDASAGPWCWSAACVWWFTFYSSVVREIAQADRVRARCSVMRRHELPLQLERHLRAGLGRRAAGRQDALRADGVLVRAGGLVLGVLIRFTAKPSGAA